MDAPAGALPAMRSPDRWLAGLRIAVGVWFAKAIFTKLSVTLAWGFLPVPTASDRWLHIMPILVTKYAEGNPIGFFREFLLNTVVPNSHVFPAHRVWRGRGRSGARVRMLHDTGCGDRTGARRELRSRGAVAGLGAAGLPLHADHDPAGDSRRARWADVGRGRLGAGPPARQVAGARTARLGDVQQVVRSLAHRDGRDHLARLGVDHRHAVGASIGGVEPSAIG